jgi:hypothetical protein
VTARRGSLTARIVPLPPSAGGRPPYYSVQVGWRGGVVIPRNEESHKGRLSEGSLAPMRMRLLVASSGGCVVRPAVRSAVRISGQGVPCPYPVGPAVHRSVVGDTRLVGARHALPADGPWSRASDCTAAERGARHCHPSWWPRAMASPLGMTTAHSQPTLMEHYPPVLGDPSRTLGAGVALTPSGPVRVPQNWGVEAQSGRGLAV